jgi:serine/threonine protein kinase
MTTCLSEAQLEALASDNGSTVGVANDVHAHLDACEICRRRLREYREAVAFFAGARVRVPVRSRGDDEVETQLPAGSEAYTTEQGVAVPGYEIMRELHRGGQGVVYEAIQLSTQRTVAVKVLLEGPFASAASRARFEREVKLVARLKHPNIVAIHDSGITQGRYFFAMDYVRGQPLDTHVRLARLSIRDIVRLCTTVCDAVGHAHRFGVMHRDLKPSNILVSEDGTPYVLDFGLAKLLDEEQAASQAGLVSTPGQAMGTLRYMSPEQTFADPDGIDIRTDVYSLGVILYELLTGAVPYETLRVDMVTALKNIRETDPPRPSRTASQIDSDVDTIVLKAMKKQPDLRYQSVSELREDLLAWLDGRPISAKSDNSLYVFFKLARRHYFHTSVITALILAMMGFGGISYHLYKKAVESAEQQRRSEQYAQVAHQDMGTFLARGGNVFRQQGLGWFLLEWHAGRTDRAREIQSDVDARSPEHVAMAFLLDDTMSFKALRAELPQSAAAMAHFVDGERHLKAGRTDDAIHEFEQSAQADYAGYEWYVRSAEARLQQLRPARQTPSGTTPNG